MNREIWKKAGHTYEEIGYGAYIEQLDRAEWDDNYVVVPIGECPVVGDQSFSSGSWLDDPTRHPVKPSDALTRRLRPGLERVRVKGEK